MWTSLSEAWLMRLVTGTQYTLHTFSKFFSHKHAFLVFSHYHSDHCSTPPPTHQPIHHPPSPKTQRHTTPTNTPPQHAKPISPTHHHPSLSAHFQYQSTTHHTISLSAPKPSTDYPHIFDSRRTIKSARSLSVLKTYIATAVCVSRMLFPKQCRFNTEFLWLMWRTGVFGRMGGDVGDWEWKSIVILSFGVENMTMLFHVFSDS